MPPNALTSALIYMNERQAIYIDDRLWRKSIIYSAAQYAKTNGYLTITVIL